MSHRPTRPRHAGRLSLAATAAVPALDPIGIAAAVVELLGVVGAVVLTALLFGLVGRVFFRTARPAGARVRVESRRPDRVLSDRETLVTLIEQNGGRMKQVQIVGRVRWSKAKVSRLLRELEGEGRIRRIRFGRENLVYLAEHEPGVLGRREDEES
jgi:uncharacterized membrane protein